MKTRAKDINEKITWQELTTGVEIYEPATSLLVETGDWRVDAVSYTHLDVYKRQIRVSTSRRIIQKKK